MERQQEDGLGHRELTGRTHGRASRSWFFTCVLFVLGFAALEVLEARSGAGGWLSRFDPEDDELDEVRAAAACGWRGEALLADGRRLEARLFGAHAECVHGGRCEFADFRAQRLHERFGLSSGGEVLRLVLRLDAEAEAKHAEAVTPVAARLQNSGSELAASLPLATAALAPHNDPLLRLLSGPAGPLLRERTQPLFLWGTLAEGDAPVIELDIRELTQPVFIELVPFELPREDVPRWFARTPETVGLAGDDPRDREIARLRAELQELRERRRERELAWYEYNRALGSLEWGAPTFTLDAGFAPPPEAVGGIPPDEAPPEPEPDPEVEARRERARQIGVSLDTLLRLEGLRGLDLLEAGSLLDGAIGPVVFRTLDDRGRLTGSISAERLRLEASRSARTLTVVLEEGAESQGGAGLPFAGGVRRIVLPHVDPEPWFDAVPELFTVENLDPPEDDGRWHLPSLRRELNRLLGLEAAGGFYRVHSLAGVLEDELTGVHLEEFDAQGRIIRRLFADRMRILLRDSGLVLELFDGAILRGEEKIAFREGRHRIFLPRSPLAEWRQAKIPSASAGEPASSEEEAATPAGAPSSGQG